jgi:hypothetical protein
LLDAEGPVRKVLARCQWSQAKMKMDLADVGSPPQGVPIGIDMRGTKATRQMKFGISRVNVY